MALYISPCSQALPSIKPSEYFLYNDFNIQYNEHNYTTELPIKLKEKTRHITIKKHIKADELAGDYIAFYAYNSAINVYINDVQVYSE